MAFQRPVIKLKPSRLDAVLDNIAWAALLFVWVYVIANYGKLPATIPAHYAANGNINGYGNKTTLFLMPVIFTVLTAGLTILNKYPHIFNYPVTLKPQNAAAQYLLATRLIRFLKLIIALLFVYTTLKIVSDADTPQQKHGLEIWFIPVLVVSFITPTIIYLYLSNKNQEE